MRKGVRFGENFDFDKTNRLNVLRKQESLPEYIQLGREARGRLNDSLEALNSKS